MMTIIRVQYNELIIAYPRLLGSWAQSTGSAKVLHPLEQRGFSIGTWTQLTISSQKPQSLNCNQINREVVFTLAYLSWLGSLNPACLLNLVFKPRKRSQPVWSSWKQWSEVCFNWAPSLGASFWVTWLVLQVTLLPVTTFVKPGKSYSITDTEDSHSTGALISSASQHKDLHVSACVRDLLHVCNYSIPSQHAMHPKCVSLFPILHSQQQRMELQHWFDSEGILVSEREPVTEPHLQTRPEISPECRFEYLDHVCKHERCWVLWRPWCEVDYQVFTAEQDPEMFCEGSARPMKTNWRKSHFESDSEPSVSSSRIMRSQTHLQLAKYGSWKHIKLSGLWQTKVKDAQCHQECVVFAVPGRILTQARLFPKLLSSLDSYL